MPAGTSTGPNDALTAIRLLGTHIDAHLLRSSLQRSGVSAAGAEQVIQGQVLTNATDRRTIAAMLSVLLKSSITTG
jgi:hypothetical protein